MAIRPALDSCAAHRRIGTHSVPKEHSHFRENRSATRRHDGWRLHCHDGHGTRSERGAVRRPQAVEGDTCRLRSHKGCRDHSPEPLLTAAVRREGRLRGSGSMHELRFVPCQCAARFQLVKQPQRKTAFGWPDARYLPTHSQTAGPAWHRWVGLTNQLARTILQGRVSKSR